LIKLASCK